MIFLCYDRCSTCQKAKKWLDENKIVYETRSVKDQNPSAEELEKWHKMSGLPLRKFFNTSGILYREMNLKDRIPEMNENEMYNLLATDGMLVKRPMLIGDDFVLTGFREKDWHYKLKEPDRQ